ncbi:TonB family protein [uncultured Erythrobacter sp.]|uniref:TonB family protein n=1 Tax=uncultured Erythrobacter sp. TaxID=263913 RepID=UPI0026213096|nr:TonB family protein [uncultured Erythrobacter sp.]
MSYAANANRLNPAAMVGALGVPGAFGAVLVIGLAVTIVVDPPVENPDVFDVVQIPEVTEAPVEPDKPSSSSERVIEEPVTTPTRPDTPYEFEMDSTNSITTLPGLGDDLIGFDPIPFEVEPIPPAPNFNPVSASPRGNPGRWITDNDYRTSWINRGYSGVASFSLEISASGRVSDCQITRSTGHDALDAATCRLLTNRARFDPAKDNSGNSVAGTYSSSVNWQIPE